MEISIEKSLHLLWYMWDGNEPIWKLSAVENNIFRYAVILSTIDAKGCIETASAAYVWQENQSKPERLQNCRGNWLENQMTVGRSVGENNGFRV